jgi:hypothetical protein
MFKKKNIDKGKKVNDIFKRNDQKMKVKLWLNLEKKLSVLNVQDRVTWEVNVFIKKKVKLLMSP